MLIRTLESGLYVFKANTVLRWGLALIEKSGFSVFFGPKVVTKK